MVTNQVFEDTVIHQGTLPSGMYLVFKILHTVNDVQRFWNSIDDLIEKEKKQIDESRKVLERYKVVLVEKGYCEFCLPILS